MAAIGLRVKVLVPKLLFPVAEQVYQDFFASVKRGLVVEQSHQGHSEHAQRVGEHDRVQHGGVRAHVPDALLQGRDRVFLEPLSPCAPGEGEREGQHEEHFTHWSFLFARCEGFTS